jgi:arylsulfatase A-like enzyme
MRMKGKMKSSIRLLMAALAVSPVIWQFGCGGTETVGDPDVVLILLDTFRSDHMSMNGYHRNTTPVIDSLAGRGTTWTRVQAQSCWTLPSMASILTGLSPRSHAAGKFSGAYYGIDQALFTLPLMLKRRAGYQTAAFFNSDLMSEEFGFDAGFDHFDCQGITGKSDTRNARETVQAFLEWYDASRDAGSPLFAALQFNDPRLPYSPPPPYDTLYSRPKIDPLFNRLWGSRRQVEELSSGYVEISQEQLEILVGLYDGELAFTDAQIGYLISGLARRDALDNTIFVLVAGNGEEFGEHGGFGHGHSLYQELLNVPLVISGRGIPVSIRSEVAAHIDVLPTVLGILSIEKPIWAEGTDLLAPSQQVSRYIPSSNLLWSNTDLAAIRLENRVIVGNPNEMDAVLYDLSNDPLQIDPLVPSRESRDELYYHWSLQPRGNPQPVFDEGSPPSLRDMGYLR